MPFFESTEQLQDVFKRFWAKAMEQTEVTEKMRASKVVVRFDMVQLIGIFGHCVREGEDGPLTLTTG